LRYSNQLILFIYGMEHRLPAILMLLIVVCLPVMLLLLLFD
jgi:hypothetical protein